MSNASTPPLIDEQYAAEASWPYDPNEIQWSARAHRDIREQIARAIIEQVPQGRRMMVCWTIEHSVERVGPEPLNMLRARLHLKEIPVQHIYDPPIAQVERYWATMRYRRSLWQRFKRMLRRNRATRR